MAFGAFFRVLFDAAFAGRVALLGSGAAPAPVAASAPVPQAPKLREAPVDSALQLLGLLQREGRLIDFLQEDVSGYGDADIGAAARVVHDSVRKALLSHVKLERVRGRERRQPHQRAQGLLAPARFAWSATWWARRPSLARSPTLAGA